MTCRGVRFELWAGDGWYAYGRACGDPCPPGCVRHGHLPGDDGRVVFTYVAWSFVDAMQARNDFLGWGPYVPMLDVHGDPLPEDVAPFPGAGEGLERGD